MPADAIPARRREPETLNSKVILGVGGGTVALVFIVIGMSWGFQRLVGVAEPSARTPSAGPPPRLQSDPAGELRDYQAAQRARLQGYGWVDQEQGRVRIPVERAMAIVAARGADAFAPPDPPREPDPRRPAEPHAPAARP